MNYKSLGILLLIICLGAAFRFFGLNWDQGFHLHPDERFLTMVAVAGKLPTNFLTYLNPITSPFNPANNNFSFYVYGILPLTITKILAIQFHYDTYELFTLLGRGLAAVADMGTLIFVFLFTKDLEEKINFPKTTKFFVAFAYAIAVLPIQLSHFFAVDIFLNFFMFASAYFSLRFSLTQKNSYIFLTALFLACAIGSKVTALAILPLDIFFLILAFIGGKNHDDNFSFKKLGVSLLVFFFSTYFFTRLTDPYLFASPNFYDPHINSAFMQSIQQLIMYNSSDAWYPPNVQWVNKLPMLFSLQNIAFFGVGIPYFIFMLLGIYKSLKKRQILILIMFTWVISLFLYQSLQYVKTMRYFIYLYPFFAIFAGIGFATIVKKLPIVTGALIGILLLLWPVSFVSIYTKPHTRVSASYWITNTIPAGSTLLSEYWDDPLPLSLPNVYGKNYRGVELHVFDPDTPEKWDLMNQQLQQGNYLILSSNRGWGSIPTVPAKYPLMSKFYADLFAGKLSYKKIAEFTSFPSLRYLGIPIDFSDSWAEEAFTVYDHPVVMIFKNTSHK